MGEGQEYIPNSEFLFIEAKSPECAAKLFSDKIKRKEFPFIKVNYGSLSVSGAVFKNQFYGKSYKVAEEKVEGDQTESQETKILEDLEIEYQESVWASFLNFCGFLNLILFVIGGIWLFNAGSNDQFMAMNLMIIGLVAGINSFFFAFLVNTFTRIQHNTHLTTLELIKLNKKHDSDN